MQPYRLRSLIRKNLPWWMINLGVAAKGLDCEKAEGEHVWYNRDDISSACYHCEVVRPGKLWLPQAEESIDENEQTK